MAVAVVVIAVGLVGSWVVLVLEWQRKVAGHLEMLE